VRNRAQSAAQEGQFHTWSVPELDCELATASGRRTVGRRSMAGWKRGEGGGHGCAKRALRAEVEAAVDKVKHESGAEGGSTLGKRPLSAGAQEGGKEGSSGDDSEATVNSTDDEQSPNSAKCAPCMTLTFLCG